MLIIIMYFDPDASLKRYFGNGAKGDYGCFLWMKHITLWTEQEKCTAQC